MWCYRNNIIYGNPSSVCAHVLTIDYILHITWLHALCMRNIRIIHNTYIHTYIFEYISMYTHNSHHYLIIQYHRIHCFDVRLMGGKCILFGVSIRIWPYNRHSNNCQLDVIYTLHYSIWQKPSYFLRKYLLLFFLVIVIYIEYCEHVRDNNWKHFELSPRKYSTGCVLNSIRIRL